ncbi:integrator complex subunit 5-like [Lineus longissimus]|uniref:integrator complex subunit 5-like n=1 Tax=Lineus longissimus TaxID=88925 RepID=UPI002B4E8D74
MAAAVSEKVLPPDNSQEILTQLKKFVNASSYKGKISREELCCCALYLLQNLPSAHHAVLEYLCDLFDEAVNAHILEIELGSNVTGTMDKSREQLENIIQDVSSVLLGFIMSNSEAWSPIISAWSIELLGHISSKYSDRQGVPHSSSLNKLLQLWMTCQPTKILMEIATECFASMIGTSPDVCINALLEASVKHSPHFDWVVAHIGSCFPTTIITRVLMCGLKDFCHHGSAQTDHHTSSESIPKITSVVGILGHLASQHGQDIKKALLNLFQESLHNEDNPMYTSAVPYLLYLASMSNMLLKVITNEFVQILTPPVLNGLADKFSRLSAPVLQDKQGLLDLSVHLVMKTDIGAANMLNFLLDIADPPSDKKSQISPVVQQTCKYILDKLLALLHKTTHSRRIETEPDIPLLAALEPNTIHLCDQLINGKQVRTRWISSLLVCISAYCGENCAARILKHIFCNAQSYRQLRSFMQLQKEIEIQLPHIVLTTINQTMEALNSQSIEANRLMENLLNIVQWENSHHKTMGSSISRVLQNHMVTLARQLSHGNFKVTMTTIQIMNLIGFSTQSYDMGMVLQLCGSVVMYFYRCLTCTEPRLKMKSIHVCSQYLQKLSQLPSATSIVLRFLMEGALMQENANLLGSKVNMSKQTLTQKDKDSLLEENIKQASSVNLPQSHMTVFHAGVIGDGLRLPPKTNLIPLDQQIFNKQCLIEALLLCGCLEPGMPEHPLDSHHDMEVDHHHDQQPHTENSKKMLSSTASHTLAQILVHVAMPDTLYNDIPWPDEDFMRVTVQRDLSIKKTFDDNPILWDVMELVASANVGFMFCSCILRGIIAPLLMFWESSREVSTRNSPKELEASCRLLECMKRGNLLPEPLCYVGEIFSVVTPYQLHLILLGVWRYIMENRQIFDPEINKAVMAERCDGKYLGVIQAVLHNNIDKMGDLYTRFFPRGARIESTGS